MEIRLGGAARARAPFPSLTVTGCTAGGATPPRPRAAWLLPRPRQEGLGAPPLGRSHTQVRGQGSGPRRLGLREGD